MGKQIERQVIATWYTPEEKLPPDDYTVLLTVSGRRGNTLYDRALMIGGFWSGEGWYTETDTELDELVVHAWCDIDPYEG